MRTRKFVLFLTVVLLALLATACMPPPSYMRQSNGYGYSGSSGNYGPYGQYGRTPNYGYTRPAPYGGTQSYPYGQQQTPPPNIDYGPRGRNIEPLSREEFMARYNQCMQSNQNYTMQDCVSLIIQQQSRNPYQEYPYRR